MLALLLALAPPVSTGLYTGSCGIVWTDTSTIFEWGNETPYNDDQPDGGP